MSAIKAHGAKVPVDVIGMNLPTLAAVGSQDSFCD